jgi:putative nucleotidyltransferase with HDIG domain
METSVLGLWEHSLGTGVAANIIAKRLHLPDCEEIATAGLLHDIGKVIVKIKCPAEYQRINEKITKEQTLFLDAEAEFLGTDHAEIGGWLAKTWFLPEKLAEPIAYHHDVAQSVNHRLKTAVVHLADTLIKTSGFGFSGDNFVYPLQQIAWDQLGMTEQLLAEIVEELEDKLIEVKDFCLDLQSPNAD